MTSVEVKVKRVLHFINGNYEQSSDEQTFEVKNPATQEVIAVVSEATEEDVEKVSQAARDAFDHGPWRTMSVADRCDKIRRMAEIILERREEIARLEALDVGKPYSHAFDMERFHVLHII